MDKNSNVSLPSLDHLFGPKNFSPSSTSGILDSIFPPLPRVVCNHSAGNICEFGNAGDGNGNQHRSSFYQNETVEPSYLSSSIYYGGQENYSSTTKSNNCYQVLKKEEKVDPNGNGNSDAVSRGNWWQGSLYY